MDLVDTVTVRANEEAESHDKLSDEEVVAQITYVALSAQSDNPSFITTIGHSHSLQWIPHHLLWDERCGSLLNGRTHKRSFVSKFVRPDKTKATLPSTN